MKKLALAVIAIGSLIATPVFACPHSDKAEATDNAPRTAEQEKPKAKDADKSKDTAKTAKPADKTKATPKKPEKVSRK